MARNHVTAENSGVFRDVKRRVHFRSTFTQNTHWKDINAGIAPFITFKEEIAPPSPR